MASSAGAIPPVYVGETPASSMETFHYFPLLPSELRTKIWHFAASAYQRIIKANLYDREVVDATLTLQEIARPNTRVSESYCVAVEGHQSLSVLFRVNRDSRDAAMRFYRVHLPCWFLRGSSKSLTLCPGILYFNPDYDFLHFDLNFDRFLVDFLHDLKTIYDPRHVGVSRLALGTDGVTKLSLITERGGSEFDPSHWNSFAETLIGLEQVFFVQATCLGRHLSCPPPTGPDAVPEYGANTAIPILPMALKFECLNPDPRPLLPQDSRVYLVADPRELFYIWGRLFHDHFGGEMPEAEYRIALGQLPRGDEIYNCEDAERWLLEDTKQCTMKMQEGQCCHEETTATAFGFWLFHMEAFGSLPDISVPDYYDEDWSRGYKKWEGPTPDLGLVRLP